MTRIPYDGSVAAEFLAPSRPSPGSASPCLNCGDPSDELFCGACREMGCSTPPAQDAVEALRKQAFKLAPQDQHRLAFFIAENLGMVLENEPEHPDSPHARSSAAIATPSEVEAKDAPVWYGADQANAWANGYNTAVAVFGAMQLPARPIDAAQRSPVQEALDLAINIIMANEPGHSCAVSDEAVALAAVAAGDTSDVVMNVIRNAGGQSMDEAAADNFGLTVDDLDEDDDGDTPLPSTYSNTEAAKQALADQAQELDMGYSASSTDGNTP